MRRRLSIWLMHLAYLLSKELVDEMYLDLTHSRDLIEEWSATESPDYSTTYTVIFKVDKRLRNLMWSVRNIR